MRALFALLLVLAACAPDEGANPAYCANDDGCASTERCYRNLCVPAGDAAPADTGTADTGVADTAPADTAPADTGTACPMDRMCGDACCNEFQTCCLDRGSLICVDLEDDEDHCGECGNDCALLQCEGGMCL